MNIKYRSILIISWGVITTVVGIIAILLGLARGSIVFMPFLAVIEIIIAMWLATRKMWITVLIIIVMLIINAVKVYLGTSIIFLLIMMGWEMLLIIMCRNSKKMR